MGRLLKVSLGTVLAVILTFVIWLFIGKVWCIIFVSALFAGGFIYLLNDLLKRFSVMKNGVSVRAERREQKSNLNLSYVLTPSYLKPKSEAVYVYTAEDGKEYWYTKEFTVLNPLFYSKPEITVYYMPDDPHRSVCKADVTVKIIHLICYTALAAIVVSLFAVLMFF